jgi:hypothetical protein
MAEIVGRNHKTNSLSLRFPQIYELHQRAEVILTEEENRGFCIENLSDYDVYLKYQEIGDIVPGSSHEENHHFKLVSGEKLIERHPIVNGMSASANVPEPGDILAKVFVAVIPTD